MRHLTQPSRTSGGLSAQYRPRAVAAPVLRTAHSRNPYKHSAPRRSHLSPSGPARSPPIATPGLPAFTTRAAATGDGFTNGPKRSIRLPGAPGRRATSSKSRNGGPTSLPPEPAADPTFVPNPEQQRAIDLVLSGNNIFLTGCAGTGKSATLREMQHRLWYERYNGDTWEYGRRVSVVATTGLAAIIVGGTTLHSLLSLRRAERFMDLARMTFDIRTLDMLAQLDTLILDEAGMMSGELLQALDMYITRARKKAIRRMRAELGKDEVARRLKAADRPFGGLQVILSGDVFQLRPIDGTNRTSSSKFGGGGSWYGGGGYGGEYIPGVARRELKPHEQEFLSRGFLFQAPVFQYGGFEVIELTQVFRQADQLFVGLLNAIRCGSDVEARAALRYLRTVCQRPLDESDGIRPTVLFGRKAPVQARNERELAALPGDPVRYAAMDRVRVMDEPPASLYEPLVAEQRLTRAEYDAWVRDELLEDAVHSEAIAKLQPSAAARAWQLHAVWYKEVHKLLMEEGDRRGGFFRECQADGLIPLKVGAQVMLVRNLDLGGKLVNGSQGVVVGFQEVEVDPEHPGMEEAVRAARAMGVENKLREWLSWHRLPLVRFVGSDRPVVVPPAVFSATLPGYGVCVRIQVPLRLAWAITVHKSQGMTLDKAEMHVYDFWGHGMLYTAISRVSSMQGMTVVGSSERKMDPWVMEWWETRQAGRRYLNPHVHPGGPPGSPPWCWSDPQQRLLWEEQSPQARRWQETGGLSWQPEEEEEAQEEVVVVEQVEVVEAEEKGEAEREDGEQQVRLGLERAVEEQPPMEAAPATAYDPPVPMSPDCAQLPPVQSLPPKEDQLRLLPRRQPHQEPQQQQQQQPGPNALPATASAAQRLRYFVERATALHGRVAAMLLGGPKRSVTKAVLLEAVHLLMALLWEMMQAGDVEDDLGPG